MKITVTGSLGNISRPLTETLVRQGHSVTVVSSKADRKKGIEALGARAAIGVVDDVDFLTSVFTGADAIYCMIPPNHAAPDLLAYYKKIGECYVAAISKSGVKRVVNLSSYGAHLERGTGIIVGSYRNEQLLNGLPGVSIAHLRPGYFYYNLYAFMPMIRNAGFIAANYGDSDPLVLVSPTDIAAAAAEELVKQADGITVRYIASDERTAQEVAGVLGEAIGKPDLRWKTISSEEMQRGLEAAGMSAGFAALYVELSGAIHNGKLHEDYNKNRPATMGKVKIEDFAKEFAAGFTAK